MKRKTIVMQGRRVAMAACGLLIGAAMMSSCEDDVLTGQPSYLGNSIYERLQDEGKYTTMLRLIDDMGQKEILSRTGSKTLFVADDEAFGEWFNNNSWGVRNYEQLSLSQRRLLLNNAMINNAYLIELLSNISGNPPQTGKCMRRYTASQATDSIPLLLPKDMPNTPVWREHAWRTDGMYIYKDQSQSPMIHFLPAFMRTNKITDSDLEILTNHESKSIEDSWVNGKRVVERDITCKNGYIQKVEGVIESVPNMADIMRQHKWNMSRWSSLVDRFSAPYYVGGLYINEANRKIDIDSIFEWRYFAELSNRGKVSVLPDGVTNVEATLKFDPGWNSYRLGSTQNPTIATDAAAMLVPSDAALDHWWNDESNGINVLKEYYHEWDSVPDLVLSKLINVNMLTSLVDAVPSKFESILDDAKMEMGVQATDVDSCFMGCNGVIYLTNRVFMPREYSSVSFPALIHQDVMSIIYWAITNLDFGPYLNSMESYYSFIVPTNTAMLCYIDPTTFGDTQQIMYQFTYDPKKNSRPQAIRFRVEKDPETGEWVKKQTLGEASEELVKNRLEDLMNMLVIVGDVEDGHEFYKTKGGSVLRIENAGVAGQMTVSGGYQMENNEPLTVSTIYDQSKAGNGKVYVTDGGMVLGAKKSVYATLKEDSVQCGTFLSMLNSTYESKTGQTEKNMLIKNSGAYTCVDLNMRLFDKYNYTVYVPTNESVQQLIDAKYLPTWEDYEAQTLEAWGDDADKQKAAKEAIANRIFNFVRYHIQDNAVYMGAEEVVETRYETAKLNPENNRFFSLLVSANSSNMTVTDQLGNVRHVLKDNGVYNKICREYWFSGSGMGRSINSASDAVVHQIDGVLLYDNSLTSKTWEQELDEIRNEN